MRAYANTQYGDSLYFLGQALDVKPDDPELLGAMKSFRSQIAAMRSRPATTRASSGPTTR